MDNYSLYDDDDTACDHCGVATPRLSPPQPFDLCPDCAAALVAEAFAPIVVVVRLVKLDAEAVRQ